MANEFTIPYTPGRSVYIQVRRGLAAWNGSAMEAYLDAHWSLYAIAAVEVGTSADYVAGMPATAPPGTYDILAFDRAGSSPSVSDTEVAYLSGYAWAGPPAIIAAPLSAAVPVVFATDEDIAVRAADDYVTLCPSSNELAVGTDGVISAGTPWTLSSAAVDFGANGVPSQGVIELKGGVALGSTRPYFGGSGRLFAVDSVAGGTATLRRPGLLSGMGQPPGAGGATGITFKVATYAPQIELASYDLYQRYGLDVLIPGRFPSDLYDARELRQLCVLEVLHDRFASAVRTSGDWAEKLKQVAAEMGDVRDRVQLKWGNLGQGDLPSNRFGMTITR